MTTDAHENRRSSARSDVDLWVDEIDGDGAVYYQRATNLSLGGLFIERTLAQPPGTRMTLSLSLPDHSLTLEAEVCEAEVRGAKRELGMSLRFVGITDQQRLRLARYLKLA